MKKRILITTILLASYIYCIYFILVGNTAGLTSNLIFGILTASSIFILPAIISKLITKKQYFGVGYVLSTLIYPLTYFVIYLFSKWFNLEAQLLYRAFALLLLTFTEFSLIYLVFNQDVKNYAGIKKSILAYSLVFLAMIGIYALLNIKTNALLSTDFLQHNAIALEIGNGRLCITPNQCSNLFKELGYTTYFHSIQAVATVGFNLEVGLSSTMLNLAFIATSFLVLLKIFRNYLKDKTLIFLGALISILVFEAGAYSFAFLIPQTFTFLLFLNLITEKKLTFTNILFTIPILLANHFIFGPIFSVFAIIYYLFTKKLHKDTNTLRVLSMISALGVIVVFLANFRGFSIEKFFQLADVNLLGAFSNYYFPYNLSFLFTQYGFLIILFLIATIYFFMKKKSIPFVYFAITYVSVSLIFFFLAPTYASKFLIGSSVFMSFLVIYMFKKLNFSKLVYTSLAIFLLISSVPFYLVNFRNYTTFYTQNSGTISGLVKEDRGVVNFLLKNNSLDYQVVSDPYTQLVVRGQTLFETAGGQYQNLETRSAIVEFTTNPNDKTYENLIEQMEISNKFCFLYSSRIESGSIYVNPDNVPWLKNLYEFEINNNHGVNNQKLTDVLLYKGFHLIYSDNNYLLFAKE